MILEKLVKEQASVKTDLEMAVPIFVSPCVCRCSFFFWFDQAQACHCLCLSGDNNFWPMYDRKDLVFFRLWETWRCIDLDITDGDLINYLKMQNNKLKKSMEHIRALEEKLQNAFNENAKLKVKQKEDEKLWNGLESKFSSTKTLCDQLTETLKHLASQVHDGTCIYNIFGALFFSFCFYYKQSVA